MYLHVLGMPIVEMSLVEYRIESDWLFLAIAHIVFHNYGEI